MSQIQIKEDVSLIRGMGFWQVWGVGVGAVVGDGIFLYLGQGIQVGGPSALVGFAFAGVMQMLIMIAMGEIAVGMPSADAMTQWVSKYLGRFWGLMSGMTFSVGWVVLGGSISLALGTFVTYWFPIGRGDFGAVFWGIVFFSIFCILNIMGAAIAGKSQLFLVLILVGIMVAFGLSGIIKGLDMTSFSPFMPFGAKGLTSTIPIGAFAFMGAACICTTGAECKKPRDLGNALVWSSITFIVVYCLAMFVVLGTVNWQDVSMKVSPFTQAAEVLWGPLGGSILNFAAWLAAATCLIMGTIYTPSRIFYGMALEGYMPKLFGKVNAHTRTPVLGIIVIWIIGTIGLICAYAFGATSFYITLCNQAVIAWSISWGLAIIAGMRYRKDIGSKNVRRIVGWKQPLYPVIPVLALAGIVYLLYLSFYDVYQWIGAAIWIGFYCIYYFSIRKKVRKGLIREEVSF